MWTVISTICAFSLGLWAGYRWKQRPITVAVPPPIPVADAPTIQTPMDKGPLCGCPPSCGYYGALMERYLLLQHRQQLYREALLPWQQALRTGLHEGLALAEIAAQRDDPALRQQSAALFALVEALDDQLANLANESRAGVFEWSTLLYQAMQLMTPRREGSRVSLWTTGRESDLPVLYGDSGQLQGVLLGVLHQGLSLASSVVVIDATVKQQNPQQLRLEISISVDSEGVWPPWQSGLLERLARLGGGTQDSTTRVGDQMLHSRRFTVPLGWQHYRTSSPRWPTSFLGRPIGLVMAPVPAALLQRQLQQWGFVATVLEVGALPTVLPSWLIVDPHVAPSLPIIGRRLDLCRVGDPLGLDLTLHYPITPPKLRQGLWDCLQSHQPREGRQRALVVGLDFAQSQLLAVFCEQLGWQLTIHDGLTTALDYRLWQQVDLIMTTEAFFAPIRVGYRGPLICLQPATACTDHWIQDALPTVPLNLPLTLAKVHHALQQLLPVALPRIAP